MKQLWTADEKFYGREAGIARREREERGGEEKGKRKEKRRRTGEEKIKKQ